MRQDGLDLIGTGGFAEYYDPTTGAALGGGRFSWTAAMVLRIPAGRGVTTFLDRARGRGSLATFGDSITAGASVPEPARWSSLLARRAELCLHNRGISGTVLQGSPDASGAPRASNGVGRFRADLLGADRADLVAILYGSNDARYTAAPATLNLAGFVRDYRIVLTGLIEAGYRPSDLCLGSPAYLPDAGFAVGAEDGFAGQTRAAFDAHVRAVRSLAHQTGTYYAAVNEAMAEDGAEALILPDHVHPNEAGHAVIASAFASATRP